MSIVSRTTVINYVNQNPNSCVKDIVKGLHLVKDGVTSSQAKTQVNSILYKTCKKVDDQNPPKWIVNTSSLESESEPESEPESPVTNTPVRTSSARNTPVRTSPVRNIPVRTSPKTVPAVKTVPVKTVSQIVSPVIATATYILVGIASIVHVGTLIPVVRDFEYIGFFAMVIDRLSKF